MSMFEILPERVTYAVEESIGVEIRGLEDSGELTIWRLGTCVKRLPCTENGTLSIGSLPSGGYGVELLVGTKLVRSAIEVSTNARSRLRYGFVTNYLPDRDLVDISDNIRRLHLNGIQFYDWAYRHANLLGGGEEYRDALGQPISLQTVRDLVTTVQRVGSNALGYAAVYAVGPQEWSDWKHDALLMGSGEPYGLGDFLFLVDPASEDWVVHFAAELKRTTEEVGFDGFHLDQYGYPKRAVRVNGVDVNVAQSFAHVIAKVRDVLPDSQLVFNNVNDFPTWVTASCPQDAIYIEVWPPQVTLDSLARVVNRARTIGEGKPVVIAAYQHVYDVAPASGADLATAFTMATLFSHGATQILAGEADRILVDPYYVRNHKIEKSTAELLKSWYDFLVEHDELLLNPEIVDVTGSYAGAYNNDCDVSFAEAHVTETAEAGAVWRRVTITPKQIVVHLINLVGQDDTLWDAERKVPGNPGASHLRIRRVGDHLPRVRLADPDGSPRLVEIPVRIDGDHAVAELPTLHIWQLILIDLVPTDDDSKFDD